MTVEAIKSAIEELSDAEREQLTQWLDELQEQAWDRQMEQDFHPGGRGAHTLERIDREIDAGNFTSLEEGFRLRRKRLATK